MNSEELANEIMTAVLAVQDRILGVGRAQYEQGGTQQFERQSLQEIIQYALEEVEDGIAYNVMLRYKLTRLRAALDLAFPGTNLSTIQATPSAPAPGPPPPTTGAHVYRNHPSNHLAP